MILRIIPMAVLAACSTQPSGFARMSHPTHPGLSVPSELHSCERSTDAPAPPKPPRTIEAVAHWAKQVLEAQEKTVEARDDCADKLHRLNRLVREHHE